MYFTINKFTTIKMAKVKGVRFSRWTFLAPGLFWKGQCVGKMSQFPDSSTEGTALLNPIDPAGLSGGQKVKWLFSLDTLTRKADVDEVLAREGMVYHFIISPRNNSAFQGR
jgi:hypothetical protein